MTTYEVLRPVTPADLGTRPSFVVVLELIPPDGRVASKQFMHLGKNRASKGIRHACSVGILARVSPHERVLKLKSVQFWLTQFNKSGHKNMQAKSGTRQTYLGKLPRFDGWLQGRSFQSYEAVVSDGRMARQAVTKSFGSVEELMEYCMDPDHGMKTAQRVVREYMAGMQSAGASNSVYVVAQSAIKSYFEVHDIVLDLRKARKNRVKTAREESHMSLKDLYKMLQNGRPSLTVRTIMLIKFQSGMDSATLADRFNYEGYSQIVKHFKADDHKSWDLAKCPVYLKLVRVKTDMWYTTFLDHDAIVQLQEYLTWKEAKHGRHDGTRPLFLNKQGRPVRPDWVSRCFSAVAVRAGIQEKASNRVNKMRGHAVRHLLKSTLKASGCAAYVADHVLGHAPRDAYEKEAILYPEEMRKEYAKASSRINIISNVESNLNSPEDPESMKAQIRELKAQVHELTQAKAGEDFIDEKRKNVTNGMNEKMNRLLRLFDALPDDIKERMSDEIDGTA